MADEDDYDYYAVTCDLRPNPPTSSCRDDQVMELLWHNGQVEMQAKRSHKKSEDPEDLIPAVVAGGSPSLQFNHHDPSLQPQNQQKDDTANNNLFIQEDEMATWLLSDFCSDLLLPSSSTFPTATTPSAVASHPARTPPAVPPPRRFESFVHFSRLNRPRATTAVEVTVVDSSDTPMVARVSDDAAGHDLARVGAESTSAGVRDAAKCDLTVTSSSGVSSANTEPIPPVKSPKAAPPLPSIRKTTMDVPEERKRIASGGERLHNGEDVELVHKEGKEHVRGGSSSTKRSRAAEVHNLSERRRRDRINKKMRALQELIPHRNKADKASMLDEAIEYLKSLQMQVQMMSMGCGMMPMMYQFPGLQQCMPHGGMGLGIGMGMGMGMEMEMNCPMVQFPHVFTGSRGVWPPLCPRFPFPAFRMPSPIPVLNNQPNTVLNSVSPHNSNHPRMPGFMDPYQQFLGLRHMHSPLHQANTSSSGLATTSKAGENSRKVTPD